MCGTMMTHTSTRTSVSVAHFNKLNILIQCVEQVLDDEPTIKLARRKRADDVQQQRARGNEWVKQNVNDYTGCSYSCWFIHFINTHLIHRKCKHNKHSKRATNSQFNFKTMLHICAKQITFSNVYICWKTTNTNTRQKRPKK